MSVSVQQFDPTKLSADLVAVFVPSDKKIFAEEAKKIQKLWKGSASLLESKDFVGARDSAAFVYTGNPKAPRLLLVGLGESEKIDAERLRRAASIAATKAGGVKGGRLAILLPTLAGLTEGEAATAVTEGGLLANYAFDRYITYSEGKRRW